MRTQFVAAVFVLTALAVARYASASDHRTPGVKPAITTLMYLVDRPDSIASFSAHAGKISIVAPQTFSMDAEGFVLGEVPGEVTEIARDKHVAVMPLVINRHFDQPLMHTVLDTAESRARVIRYLVYYALRDGYLGFQFDFENIRYTYRDRFTAFFQEAAREFHRNGLQLSAAVVGRLDDTRNSNSPGGYDNWSGVYDYERLGKYADFISVMAYTEHGADAAPGPVAGLPWVKSIAEYSARAMSPRKISLGVPFYAMRWEITEPKGRGHSARYRDAAAALASAQLTWDETESSPHVTFDSNGRRTDLWFENARSLEIKMRLAHDMGFPGISAWVLGQEDPAFWDALDAWQVRHPRTLLAKAPFDQRSKAASARMAAAGGGHHETRRH